MSMKPIHGMSFSPEYRSWRNMKERCCNPKNHNFHRYGKRGIKVCKRWLNSFEKFFKDMGKKPSASHTLDRYPDNNGDYKPSNCRWATPKQQARNASFNLRLTFRGKTKSQVEWSEITGLFQGTISNRIRSGWSVKDALTKPPNAHVTLNEWKGE